MLCKWNIMKMNFVSGNVNEICTLLPNLLFVVTLHHRNSNTNKDICISDKLVACL